MKILNIEEINNVSGASYCTCSCSICEEWGKKDCERISTRLFSGVNSSIMCFMKCKADSKNAYEAIFTCSAPYFAGENLAPSTIISTTMPIYVAIPISG